MCITNVPRSDRSLHLSPAIVAMPEIRIQHLKDVVSLEIPNFGLQLEHPAFVHECKSSQVKSLVLRRTGMYSQSAG